ncbi:MAG: hypothetical protein K6T17_06405 [Fimbriimonadales bacterium]|nr:hypothetical protein [Fimbriimonadales bacterium]
MEKRAIVLVEASTEQVPKRKRRRGFCKKAAVLGNQGSKRICEAFLQSGIAGKQSQSR